MEIQQKILPVDLPNLAEDVLGFDLEMANSFRREHPVICMIGTEYYDRDNRQCIATIASITRREEEPALIDWFLDHLRSFAARHEHPRLLTFSGDENDVPWVRERLLRFNVPQERQAVLNELESLDLRVEFEKRTQTNRISLKKLEEQFGIERQSQMSSRKVSFVLTDVLSGNGRRESIPENIYDYLSEDVHYLLVILNDWHNQSLESHYMTEYDYLNRVVSLLRLGRRLTSNGSRRRINGRLAETLDTYMALLASHLESAVSARSFQDFALPALPEFNLKHPELERVVRRYQSLAALEIYAKGSGKPTYRLAKCLSGPKGALAVVTHRGKVLMIKRADHIERAPGFWGLPGGELENGETPGQAAVRELAEEVNLQGEAVQLLGTSTSVNGTYELFWVEVAVHDVSTLEPHAAEVSEARWIAQGELKALEPLIPGAREGFRDFLGSSWVR